MRRREDEASLFVESSICGPWGEMSSRQCADHSPHYPGTSLWLLSGLPCALADKNMAAEYKERRAALAIGMRARAEHAANACWCATCARTLSSARPSPHPHSASKNQKIHALEVSGCPCCLPDALPPPHPAFRCNLCRIKLIFQQPRRERFSASSCVPILISGPALVHAQHTHTSSLHAGRGCVRGGSPFRTLASLPSLCDSHPNCGTRGHKTRGPTSRNTTPADTNRPACLHHTARTGTHTHTHAASHFRDRHHGAPQRVPAVPLARPCATPDGRPAVRDRASRSTPARQHDQRASTHAPHGGKDTSKAACPRGERRRG